MMIDVLTEMCAAGGCATHCAIADECKRCVYYCSEIERRKALLLADGTDELRFGRISQALQVRAAKGG